MSHTTEIKNPVLFKLSTNFVEDALKALDKKISQRWHIGVADWPDIGSTRSGLPFFRVHGFGNNPDFRKAFAFGTDNNFHIDPEKMTSFQKLFDYIDNDEQLKAFFSYEHLEALYKDDRARQIRQGWVLSIFVSLVARYRTQYPEKAFDLDVFTLLYLPIENYLVNKSLPVMVGIPVLFLKFNFIELEIAENIQIKEISPDYQRARAMANHETTPFVLEVIVSSATHMICIGGKKFSNQDFLDSLVFPSDKAFYPEETIDAVFMAIRLVTGFNTGYAQLISIPENWVRQYHPYFPEVMGTSVRKYPVLFEHYYWNKTDIPTIDIETAQKIRDIYSKLIEHRNHLAVVMRRLNFAFLREHNEDALLDATIAMEALLLTESKGEIRYRLAIRMAALLQLATEDYNAAEVLYNTKLIYDRRSSLAHGTASTNKATLKGEEPDFLKVALDYLRTALLVLLEYPDLLKDQSKIDKELLLKNITPPKRRNEK